MRNLNFKVWSVFIFILSLVFLFPPQAHALDAGVTFKDKSALLSSFVRTGPFYLGGAVWFDYNNDGNLDLFIPGIAAPLAGVPNALFRNNGNGTFTNVAFSAGVADITGHTSAAAGDLDNDGCTDLVLGNNGDSLSGLPQAPAKIYHNNCNGTFTDITATSGINPQVPVWGISLADFNNTGHLDIFFASAGTFGQLTGTPLNTANILYKNNGNLTFTDVSAGSGVNIADGSCVSTTLHRDTNVLPDLLVGDCNEVHFTPTPIHYFRNDGNYHFTDIGPQVGLTQLGYWEGVGIGDVDGNGKQDFFFANAPGNWEGNPHVAPHVLYTDNGNGGYTEVASQSGVANLESTFGANISDFDNDGHDDLMVTGTFETSLSGVPPEISQPANPGRYMRNDGAGHFTSFQTFGLDTILNSGMSVGDYNNDGFLDSVVVTTTTTTGLNNVKLGIPKLLLSRGNNNHHVTVKLVGMISNKNAVGAQVTVFSADGRTQLKEVRAGSSFVSMDSMWLTFGLGDSSLSKIVVKWPSGVSETFMTGNVSDVTLVQGTGN